MVIGRRPRLAVRRQRSAFRCACHGPLVAGHRPRLLSNEVAATAATPLDGDPPRCAPRSMRCQEATPPALSHMCALLPAGQGSSRNSRTRHPTRGVLWNKKRAPARPHIDPAYREGPRARSEHGRHANGSCYTVRPPHPNAGITTVAAARLGGRNSSGRDGEQGKARGSYWQAPITPPGAGRWRNRASSSLSRWRACWSSARGARPPTRPPAHPPTRALACPPIHLDTSHPPPPARPPHADTHGPTPFHPTPILQPPMPPTSARCR